MNRDEAVRLGVRNQIAFFRHLASTIDGGRIEEDDRYLLFAGGHEYPGTYTNGAIRKTPAIGAAELFARADEFFGVLGRQYVLWALAHADADLEAAAEKRGLPARPPEEGNPCIVLTERLAAVPSPPGYDLELVHSDADRRAYLSIVVGSYGLAGVDEQLAETLLFSVNSLRADNVAVFVARDRTDGAVHSGISVFLAGDCLGLEWAATDPAARGRGLAVALMQRATAWGFDRGAGCAWGVASAQGTPIWLKLGFEVSARYRRFLVAPPTLSHSAAKPRKKRQ